MINKQNTIEEYISTFPKDIQILLQVVYSTIKKAAPQAEEVISYRMPAFKQNGILVYFAAFTKHIGFFPTASGIKAFQNELTNYKCTKGTIQLPFDKPIPLDLIIKIVKFRIEENEQKTILQKKKKK